MSQVTTVFLIIAAVGIGVLAISLLVGDLVHFGHPDVDGPFSLPAVAGFVGAFGLAGAVGSRLGDSRAVAIGAAVLVGLLAAVPTAWFAVRLARAASAMHTDATPTREDFVGTTGVVVSPIPHEGYGEVRVLLGGQPVKLNARAARPMALGTRILVIEAPTPTSVIVEDNPFVKEH